MSDFDPASEISVRLSGHNWTGISRSRSESGAERRRRELGDDHRMYVGTLQIDIKLPPDSRTLKVKRSYVRPVLAALKRLEVAASEVGSEELYGRTLIGVAAVSNSVHHLKSVLHEAENLAASRPELEILSVAERVFSNDDE